MRRFRLAVWLGLLAVAPLLRAADPVKRVLMVSIDGLMPGYYVRADELGMKIPNLRRLMREGAYATGVVGVLPTVTYPSHTTLISGVPPRIHGIASNTVFDPYGRSGGAWEWYASAIQVPTLVSAARDRALTTASVSWPVSVGIGSDSCLPEFWRPGSEHEIDLKLLELASTPGLVDRIARHRGRPFPYPLTEAERVDAAVYVLEVARPQLTLLHILDLDGAEHHHGPWSAEATAAVEKSDADLGRVLAALKAAGVEKETLVAVVSDHGFLPTSRTLRPNVLLREAGLIQVGTNGKVTSWKAIFHSNGGSAALHLEDGADPALLARVRDLFESRRREPGSGIRDILDREQVKSFGGTDSALVLNAHEGVSFSGAVVGEWSGPSAADSKGNHGYVPDRDELHASLILSGPGFEGRGNLGVVRMTAIAPTLARYLGLTLDPRADSPLPSR